MHGVVWSGGVDLTHAQNPLSKQLIVRHNSQRLEVFQIARLFYAAGILDASWVFFLNGEM